MDLLSNTKKLMNSGDVRNQASKLRNRGLQIQVTDMSCQSTLPFLNLGLHKAIQHSENKIITHFEDEVGPGMLQSSINKNLQFANISHSTNRIDT